MYASWRPASVHSLHSPLAAGPRRDDGNEVDPPQQRPELVGLVEVALSGGQLLQRCPRHRLRIELGQSRQQFVPGPAQGVVVLHGRLPADGRDLCLETAGQHGGHPVLQHVLGLRLDHGNGLGDVPLGGPPLEERGPLFGGAVPDEVVEPPVENLPVTDLALPRPPLVADADDDAVVLGVLHPVLVEEAPR